MVIFSRPARAQTNGKSEEPIVRLACCGRYQINAPLLDQAAHSFFYPDLGGPIELLAQLSNVADIDLLVAETGLFEANRRLLARSLCKQLMKLRPHRNGISRPSADVINLACRTVDVLYGHQHEVDKVVHVQDVPDLL